MKATATYPSRPGSVSAARRFVTEYLGDLSLAAQQPIELMVSELVTNAVRHARTDFTLSVEWASGQVRVEVHDDGAGHPQLKRPGMLEPTGRGLQIVSALADDWGVIAHDDGKTVWFRCAVSTAAPAGGSRS